MNKKEAATGASGYVEATECSERGGDGSGNNSVCRKCGRPLTGDETALHRKLFNRAAESFFCIDCSAEYFEVTRELLEEKIRQFKAMGCTLFTEAGDPLGKRR